MNAIFTSIMLIINPINYDIFNDYWEWRKECQNCPYLVCEKHNKGTDHPLYKVWVNRDKED